MTIDETAVERFNQKYRVNEITGCWNWTGGVTCGEKNKMGYGMFRFEGHTRNAHRVSYQLFIGPPGILNVLHKCDNSMCVNPKHLYLGTQTDNVRDMIAKGRGRPFGDRNKNKTHCPKGHDYNEENTYQYRGRRQCKTCKRDSNRVSVLRLNERHLKGV